MSDVTIIAQDGNLQMNRLDMIETAMTCFVRTTHLL